MTDKIAIDRAVVEQALEMLNRINAADEDRDFLTEDEAVCTIMAIDELDAALRAALEQPQVEQPTMTHIAQRKLDSLIRSGFEVSGYSIYHQQKQQHGFVTTAGVVGWWRPEGAEYPQPQVEQEPVGEAGSMPGTDGFTMACFRASDVPAGTKLYTHPQNLRCKSNQARLATLWGYEKPQPPRQPLTNEQIDVVWDTVPQTQYWWRRYARAVERAHGIGGEA